MKIASANLGNEVRGERSIDYRLDSADALAEVDRVIDLLEGIVQRAGAQGGDILALPEECLGLSSWEAAHREAVAEVIPQAVSRMLGRLGAAASAHSMYLICCNDTVDADGKIRNSAILLDRTGSELGRYHKVGLPAHEQSKKAGEGFPVFRTPDSGTLGMLICYDMVFPEPMRCMSLEGAHVVFVPTEGGAAFGDAALSRAAFQVRAAENFTYLVVSWGGWGGDTGSMVISPTGEVLAEERRGGELAVADIDPYGGRRCEGWSNSQEDMRARLYRERRPEAYSVLTDRNPPVLAGLPPMMPGPPEEIIRINERAITLGHGEYEQAEELIRSGKTAEAIEAFEALSRNYPATWFERIAEQRLETLREGPS